MPKILDAMYSPVWPMIAGRFIMTDIRLSIWFLCLINEASSCNSFILFSFIESSYPDGLNINSNDVHAWGSSTAIFRFIPYVIRISIPVLRGEVQRGKLCYSLPEH